MKRLILTLLAVAALPAAAGAVTASPAASGGQSLYISTTLSDTVGKRADPTIYNIEGSTYFKLRDVGRLMNFGVRYDAGTNTVLLEPNKPYVPEPDESTANTAVSSVNATPSTQRMLLAGESITPKVYNIKGNNYLGLRELGKLVDFSVTYQYDSKRITAYSAYPYADEGTWTAAMNDLAGNLRILPASSFNATAARYAHILTGDVRADWTALISALRAVKDAPPVFGESGSLHRANLYWADKLTAGITNTAAGATPVWSTTLTDLADADLFDNPDKSLLRADFKALSTAYLGQMPAQTASVSISSSISKDARARLTLADEYAAGRKATDVDETAAKAYFADDMAALSALRTDRERLAKIHSLLQREFRSGSGGAYWTTAYNKTGSMDSFSFAAAAEWMFAEAGMPAFIARSYNRAWNLVYVDGTWAVYDAAAGDGLHAPDSYLRDDINPPATLLLTQVMRPGAPYYNSKTAPVDKYFTYTEIAAKSVATAAQMQSYIKRINPNVAQSVIDMIPFYLSEGEAEGIRGDLAFAQSCLETGNFGFAGSAVTLEQNNFCGLGVVTNGVEGAKFETPQLGIRAQIQHLKAYANRDPLKNDCVDPRFSLVTRGNAATVQHLGMQENPKGYGWAAGANYGTKILNILDYILAEPVA